LNSIASKTKKRTTMPRNKKSTVGYRRKNKSNTTTTTPRNVAKRSKIDDKKPAEYRNGILHGIRVILGKMDEKDLLAVMMYVGSMEGAIGEKQTTTTTSAQPRPAVGSVTATAREEATAITTVTVHPSPCPTTTTEAPANPTTTEAANPTTEANHPPTSATTTTTTVPPSPQDPVIQLNRKTRPSPHNTIVTIDPRCFHCDGRTELEATKCKQKSINTIVNSIVENNLTPEQRAFALKQVMV